MGKLTDLQSIYKTYQQNIIQEMSISEPMSTTDMPSSPMSPSPTATLVMNDAPSQNDEECVGDSESNADMAKSELFNIMRSANELMNILKSPNSKVEPWQLSKLVKASDYVCAVKGSMEYDNFEKHCSDLQTGMQELGDGMQIASQIKNMLAGEGLNVNEEVLRQIIFNIECLLENKNN
jgi:hypothetical protein